MCTVSFDLAGQLTSEVKSSGYSASYTYDANGNRLSRTVNGVTENYSYDAGDKLLAVTGGVDPRSFVYDAAGRTTSIQRASGNTNFTYDYESRVTSITKPGMVTNLMSYNGLGTRVGLTDSGGSKQYVRDGVGVTSPVLSDGNSTFTAGGERTGVVSKTLHSGLKNDDLQTNASGSVIGERLYDAFGNLVSNSGAWSSHSGYGGKFGYQDDADSSLKLLGHRYYDSSTGRFLTRDPIKDGRNWYVYCGSNPVSSADPSGLLLIVVLGVGAGLIAIASLGRWFYERKLEQEEDNRNKKDMEDRIIENELNIDSPVENTDHLINENRNRILDGLERQRQNALAQANSIYISGPATRSVVEVGAGFGAIFKIFQDYEEAKDVVSGTVEIGKAGYDEVKDRLKSQRHKLGGARDLWPRPVH